MKNLPFPRPSFVLTKDAIKVDILAFYNAITPSMNGDLFNQWRKHNTTIKDNLVSPEVFLNIAPQILFIPKQKQNDYHPGLALVGILKQELEKVHKSYMDKLNEMKPEEEILYSSIIHRMSKIEGIDEFTSQAKKVLDLITAAHELCCEMITEEI